MELWDVAGATPLDLTVFARQLPDELGNTLNQVIPDRVINGISSRVTRTTRRKVTARYRTWNAETYIGERPVSVDMTDVRLPPFGQMLILTEWERIQLYMAQNGSLPFDQILEQIYDDVELSLAATRNRAEQARGQFLSTGKFTLNENGLRGVEYDAQVPSSHLTTVGTWWSDPAAPLLSNLLAAKALIAADARGAVATKIVAPSVAANYARTNAEFKLAYYGASDVATLRPTLSAAQVAQVLSDNGLPQFTIYDNQLEIDGVNTRVMPANKITMIADSFAEFQWGTSPQSLDLVTTPNVDFTLQDAPGLIALAWKRPNPTTGYTEVAGVGMPVAGDPAAMVTLQVLP